MSLTQEQLKRFNQEGYVVIRSALQDTDIEQVIQDYEEIIDKLARDLLAAGRISHLYENEPFETRLARICDEDEATYFASDQFLDVGHVRGKGTFNFMRNQRLLDLVESVIGPEISCSPMTHIRAKLPSDLDRGRSSNIVSWHQDVCYWGLDTDDLVTAWIALSPASLESGCMHVLPGSHKGEVMPHTDEYKDANLLTRGQEIAVPIDESQPVPMALEPGEVSLHNVRIAHASEPNRSDDRRIGLSMHYIPTSARQQAVDWDTASLVRGTDNYHHFALAPRPRHDFDPDAVRFHEQASTAFRDILFKDADRIRSLI